MTVAELIELLKTFPQDIPVTGYNGQETTDFITKNGVRLEQAEWGDQLRLSIRSDPYVGPYVDIMGF